MNQHFNSDAITRCIDVTILVVFVLRIMHHFSEDYGKSFHDISHAINNTFIKKDFGISAGPGNPQQVCVQSINVQEKKVIVK